MSISDDNGETFRTISTNCYEQETEEDDEWAGLPKLIDLHKDGSLLAAYYSGFLIFRNGGASCEKIHFPGDIVKYSSSGNIKFSPSNSNIVYLYETGDGNTDPKIHEVNLSEGTYNTIPCTLPIRGFDVVPGDSDTIYIKAYTDAGEILESKDKGLTWNLFNNDGEITGGSLKTSGGEVFLRTDDGIYIYK